MKPPEDYTLDEFFNQGRAAEKGVTEDEVDAEQLAMGIKVEAEHTDNEEVAKKIALDHLAEIPDYYTRLKKMEDDAKAEVAGSASGDKGAEGEPGDDGEISAAEVVAQLLK